MADMPAMTHSVMLESDKCKGCTTCIRHCPSEAIRVRGGLARITSEKCIDCGECIRVCPHHAKRAVYDDFDEMMSKFEYRIALPAPTLYGQFNNLDSVDYVLVGLLRIGFNAVFEVSKAAEIISGYTRRLLAEGKVKTPIISSACPAVIRIIRARFPYLCSYVLPVKSPMQLAASLARREAMDKTGLPSEKIGVFFISPCPAKVTDVRYPIGLDKSDVDGVFSISAVYKPLLAEMNNLADPDITSESGLLGINWAVSGGEASGLLQDKYLAADGVDNVMKVLDELENMRLPPLDFIELNACPGGCVGGPSTVENPFIAKARIQMLRKDLPFFKNDYPEKGFGQLSLDWNDELTYRPVTSPSTDMASAFVKLSRIEQLKEEFPGLDCGACGAPTCDALARDIVEGTAKKGDCLFFLKKSLEYIIGDTKGNAVSIKPENGADQ